MAKASVEKSGNDGAVRPLAEVLGYRNDLVVRRFRKRFDLSRDEAEAVFVDLLRWLWYLASTNVTSDNPEAHAIDAPLVVIDEMWHEFILVTRDYTSFCNDMLGRYIHHAPARSEDEPPPPGGAEEVKAALAALIGRKRAKYAAVYDVLGRNVFARWYLDYPRRFSAEALSQVRREAGRVPTVLENPVEELPIEDRQEKDEIIDEAVFLNLLLSSPASTGATSAHPEGDRAAGWQDITA